MKKLFAIMLLSVISCEKVSHETEANAGISFDYSRPIVRTTDVGNVTIYENQKPNLGVIWGKAIFRRSSDGKVSVMYIKMQKKGDIGLVTYYDATFKHHLVVKLNYKLQTVTTSMPSTPANAQHKGQDVMNCINDIYSNHGWVSVAMWGITLFVPETGIMVIVRCVTYDGFKNIRSDNYVTVENDNGTVDTFLMGFNIPDSLQFYPDSSFNKDSL